MQIVFPDAQDDLGFKNLAPDTLWAQMAEPGMLALGVVADTIDGVAEPCAASLVVVQLGAETARLLWIFTEPDHRLLGLASVAMRALLEELFADPHCTRLEVLFTYEPARNNLFAFLLAMGATPERQAPTAFYRTTVGELASCKLPTVRGPQLLEVSQLSPQQLARYSRRMGVPLSSQPEDYHPASMAAMKRGQPVGLLLLEQADDVLGLTIAHCSLMERQPALLLAMLHAVRKTLLDSCDDGTVLTVATLNKSGPLLSRLLDMKRYNAILYRADLTPAQLHGRK